MKKNLARIAAIGLILLGFYNFREFMKPEYYHILGSFSGGVLAVIGFYLLYRASKA